MADVGYLAMVAAGFGAYWWRHLRLARSRVEFSDALEPDAEVALHVALHEAATRRARLSSIHVLYGLLQDEAITGAIAAAGARADALEDRVLDELGRGTAPDPVGWRIEVLAGHARLRGRRASCIDLFAALAELPAAALCDRAGLRRGDVMYALVHGGRPPEIAGDGPDVLVVLRNDDYTTQQFVQAALVEVFGLAEDQASARMLQTHREGRATVGRYAAADARAKIAEVRDRAQAQAYPLWIATEPT